MAKKERKKGRNRHGAGAFSDWVKGGRKVGRKAAIELPSDGSARRARKWFYGRTDEDLEAKIAAWRERQERGLVDTKNLTVRGYLEAWLADTTIQTARDITLDSYERKVRNHVYPAIGQVRLMDLSADHVKQIHRQMRNSGQSDRSIQYVHRILHKAFGDAVIERKLAENPTNLVRCPRIERKEMQTVPPEQLESLVSAIREDWLFPLFYVALATGCRRGELCALRWSDVDLSSERPSIQVGRSTHELPGKIAFSEPKTRSAYRQVPLTPATTHLLRQHRRGQLRQRQVHGAEWNSQSLVFTNPNGGILRPSVVSNHWRRIREAAGVKKVTLHGLRHSHALLLLSKNIHLKVIQERLGHSSFNITMDYYGHVSQTMQDEAVRAISELLPAPCNKSHG